MKLHDNPRLDLAGKFTLAGAVLMIVGLILILTGCSSAQSQPVTAADGLDLHALVGVVRQANNGEDLERRLNSPGGINNLDLTGDGKVDFIDVTEFGDGSFRGYSLAVHMDEHNTQEVATINISQVNGDIAIQVHGNEQIYGQGAFVVNHINRAQISTMPFLIWAFAPRPLYIRPIVIGYRPLWYTPIVPVPVIQYRTVTRVVTKTVVVERPKAAVVQAPATSVNPNAGKSSTIVKAPLVAPTATQQAFQARPENKPVATGGFGAKKQIESSQQKAVVPPPSKDTTVKQFEQRDTQRPATTGGFGTKPAPRQLPPSSPGKR